MTTQRLRTQYLRMVRRAYRSLKHPRIRNRPWLQALIRPVFNQDLWRPCRETVAGGLAIGLFFSQLPIPGQGLLAALACTRAKVNIPFAFLASWLTNPLTHVPFFFLHIKIGDFFRHVLNLPDFEIIEKAQIGQFSLASYVIGFVATGFILGLLAYPLVYGLSAIVPRILPKRRHKRGRLRLVKTETPTTSGSAEIIAFQDNKADSTSTSHPTLHTVDDDEDQNKKNSSAS